MGNLMLSQSFLLLFVSVLMSTVATVAGRMPNLRKWEDFIRGASMATLLIATASFLSIGFLNR